MRPSHRDSDIHELEERHQTLSRRVEMLRRRAHLTPSEQEEFARLKKEKLAAKDQLYEARSA
jgi:uncharacterized protein YdcH (DUF465 family)